jgi:hypothetical protein
MRWGTKAPTKPGHYWWRPHKDGRDDIIEVVTCIVDPETGELRPIKELGGEWTNRITDGDALDNLLGGDPD